MTKTDLKHINCEGISVTYSDQTNGAGLETRFDFLNAVKRIFPNRKFKHCYEWCCGPGFFGYSLLGAEICEALFLADYFAPALEQARQTATTNQLLNRVEIVQSKSWENISCAEKKFDLIIGNPPHFCLQNYYNELWTFEKRIYIDENWQTHRDFFAGVKNYLAPDGEILLMECAWGSGINVFAQMIDAGGLKIINHFIGDYWHDKLGFPVYYLHLRHK